MTTERPFPRHRLRVLLEEIIVVLETSTDTILTYDQRETFISQALQYFDDYTRAAKQMKEAENHLRLAAPESGKAS